MTHNEAAAIIRTTLNRERAMRERVFAHKPDMLAAKVGEIDRALNALDILADAAQWGPMDACSEIEIEDDVWLRSGILYVEHEIGVFTWPIPDGWAMWHRVTNATEPARPGLFDETQP